MKRYHTALELLAEELEGMKSEVQSMAQENGKLRQDLVLSNARYQSLLNMSIQNVLTNYENEVIVELAVKLAPAFGLTRGENYRKMVREFLHKPQNFPDESL